MLAKKQLLTLLNANMSYKLKMAKAMLILDEMAGMIVPMTPCQKGCSFCCHQSLMITSWEAEQIEKLTGRQADQKVNYEWGKGNARDFMHRYSGVPCTFLNNNVCSIYELRPIACRLHLSMDNSSDPCDLVNSPNARVPYFNFEDVKMALMGFLMMHDCRFADIREFFKNES